MSNAETLWRAFAAARGHQVVDEPGWLVVDAGKDLGGTRVILREPVVGETTRILEPLVESASRPVVVDDPQPGGRTVTASGSATTTLFTGLANGTRYTFTITASNARAPQQHQQPAS